MEVDVGRVAPCELLWSGRRKVIRNGLETRNIRCERVWLMTQAVNWGSWSVLEVCVTCVFLPCSILLGAFFCIYQELHRDQISPQTNTKFVLCSRCTPVYQLCWDKFPSQSECYSRIHEIGITFIDSNLGICINIWMYIPIYPQILIILEIISTYAKLYIYTDIIAIVVCNKRYYKHFKCLWTDQWLSKLWFVQSEKYWATVRITTYTSWYVMFLKIRLKTRV